MIDEIKKSGKSIPAVCNCTKTLFKTVKQTINNKQPSIHLASLSLNVKNPFDSEVNAFIKGKYKIAKSIAERTDVLNKVVVFK